MLVEGFGVSDSVGVAGIRTWVAGISRGTGIGSGYRVRVLNYRKINLHP